MPLASVDVLFFVERRIEARARIEPARLELARIAPFSTCKQDVQAAVWRSGGGRCHGHLLSRLRARQTHLGGLSALKQRHLRMLALHCRVQLPHILTRSVQFGENRLSGAKRWPNAIPAKGGGLRPGLRDCLSCVSALDALPCFHSSVDSLLVQPVHGSERV